MKSDVVFALENAGWPALLIDGANTICRSNPAAVKIFGAALEGEFPSLASIWSHENRCPADQFLPQWERSPSATSSLRFRGRGGQEHSFLASICAYTRDRQKYYVMQLFPEGNTEAKAQSSETTFTHRQKLDCALQFTRTVSLDLNNALTGVLGHSSLLLSQMDPEHIWRSPLVQIERSAARAAELADDLAAFSRQQKAERAATTVNANVLLQRSLETVQQKGGRDPIEWTLRLERKLFATRLDEAKVLQALVQLIQNATEALRGNGRIVIRTHNLELSQPTQDRNVHLAAGAYICIEISDNGCGMEPDVLPRVFEPFFTTKRDSNHRGLGLALVYGIITNHGGGVAVSSQPGVGTSFRVYLPAEKKLTNDNSLATNDLRGAATILVVDDEELLLTVQERVLSAYGYQVRTASGGQKAIEILSQQDGAVDLVITDLVMPVMSGRELIDHIHRVSPETRIICSSGYPAAPGHQNDPTYLQKPFTSQELLVKVKAVLTPAV